MLTCDLRKLNESSSKVEDPAVLKMPLCTPKVKKITLHFPLGLEVVARNMKGVTIKDALDAIHKQFKKRVSIHLSLTGSGKLSRSFRSSIALLTLLDRQHPDSHTRQTTSSRSHTSLVSSGIAKSATPASSSTSRTSQRQL